MLRLAVDLTSLLTPRTGVGVLAHELTIRLASRADLAVTAFAVTLRGRGALGEAVPPGVRVVSRPLPARPLRAAWSRSDHPRIDHWIGRHDVVFGPNFVVPPTRAGALVTVHDLSFVHFPRLATPSALAYPRLIRRALARGAWVHTSSDFVRTEIIEHFGAEPTRVTAIPPGVRVTPPGDPAPGRRLAGTERYVLAIGTVEPRKDLPRLVRAFDAVAAEHPDVRLVIAGPDGWGADALGDAIDAARHAARVVRLGWVSDPDREALLRGATVYAYPSIYEGFGFPPLEAMTAGAPVVATSAGSLPEVCRNGADLVPPGDTDALAAALDRALHDEEHRRSLVARGRAVAATYSWDATAERFVALAERVAADRAGRAGRADRAG
ncbi:MAG TPA: glycosyltransferase family 1 protein [Acidimicrobiales bacterium]